MLSSKANSNYGQLESWQMYILFNRLYTHIVCCIFLNRYIVALVGCVFYLFYSVTKASFYAISETFLAVIKTIVDRPSVYAWKIFSETFIVTFQT